MGIFDRLFGSGGGDDGNDPPGETAKDHIENPAESDILLDPELLEGKVNVDRRAEIIDTHYDDVSTDDARFIAETVKEYVESYDLRKGDARSRIEERTGLDRDRVVEILWTERSSVQNCDKVRSWQDAETPMMFVWKLGDECSQICADVEEATAGRDEPIPLGELQELLREKAEEYADEGGTPERMDHWVPHHKCKALLQMKV
ncbi:hypothetical protein [Halorubrum trueperi]|uniref:Uncharacterized protein n=1 Tax=Halorubrum trueperi TaxID=2004704 RepID=A0ABD5UGB2_9EURY